MSVDVVGGAKSCSLNVIDTYGISYYNEVESKRASHRPSRKHNVMQAAMRLYAVGASSAAVTVADIAAEADMTEAAVYYHYATKEDILLEGLSTFGDDLLAEVSAFMRSSEGTSPALVIAHLLDWVERDRDTATVWFAAEVQLDASLEVRRRVANESLMTEIVKAVKAHRPSSTLPHAAIIAAALLSAIEVSTRAWLVRDDVLVAGREDAFRRDVSDLGSRIVDSRPPMR